MRRRADVLLLSRQSRVQELPAFSVVRGQQPIEGYSECQMTVHLFGNGSSPAVATFGMRKTADHGEEKFGTETKEFVHRDFYVDDSLTSRATEPEVTDLVKNAQAMLATANL